MWVDQNQNVIDNISYFPDGCVGFIYKITNINNGKFYIGKKILYTNNKVKLGKKEIKNLPINRGRKKIMKQVIKESNWLTYNSSSENLVNDIKILGENNFKKEIIKLAYNKNQLTYWETKYLFIESVIENDLSYNLNILGKFYKGKI